MPYDRHLHGAPSKPIRDAIAEYQANNPYSQQAFEGLFGYLQGLGYNVARTTHAGNTLASNDALVTDTGDVYDLVFNSDNAPGAGSPRWVTNPAGSYDPSRMVVGPDGTFIKYDDWLRSVGGTPGTTPPPDAGSPGQPASTTPAPPSVLGQGGAPPVVRRGVGRAQIGYDSSGRAVTVRDDGRRAPTVIGASGGSSGPPSPPSAGNPYDAANSAAARARAMSARGGRRSTIIGGFGVGAPATRPASVLGR